MIYFGGPVTESTNHKYEVVTNSGGGYVLQQQYFDDYHGAATNWSRVGTFDTVDECINHLQLLIFAYAFKPERVWP